MIVAARLPPVAGAALLAMGAATSSVPRGVLDTLERGFSVSHGP
jgi:hypothetical protein